MKLWLISQTVNDGYDTYDSAVVAAETKEEARMTHPSGNNWNGEMGTYDSWCDAKDVSVEFVGIAKDGTKAGIICASFNAG